MNKQKFIDLLRKPHTATKDSVTELESVIEQFPYFQSAHIVLAKGSKSVKHPKTARRISSAAVYSTDRALLKKYINDNIIFLDITKEQDEARQVAIEIEEKELKKAPKTILGKDTKKETSEVKPQKPKVEHETPQQLKTPDKVEEKQPPEQKAAKNKTEKPSIPQGRNKIPPLNLEKSDFDADAIIDEMKTELEEYKKNKKQFDDWVQHDEERSAVEAALKKVTEAEKEKNLAAEIQGEEDEKNLTSEVQEEKKSTSEDDTSSILDSIKEEVTPIVPKVQEETKGDNNIIEDDNNTSSVKGILPVEEVKPVEFKNAPIPKPKSSGYSGKIFIEGSNKNAVKEVPEEEPKKAKRTTKRVVTKVKKTTESTQEIKEEIKSDTKSDSSTSIQDESSLTDITEKTQNPDSLASEAPTKVDNKPEETVSEPDNLKSETTEEQNTLEDTSETKPESNEPLPELKEKVTEAKEEVTEPIDTAEEPEDTVTSKEDTKEINEPVPSSGESINNIEDSIDDIPSPSEDDSTPDEENSFDLEVNEDKGVISREDDKFDIKKDKKRAGQLRKEKMRKLREQRGIIDEFIETDPQMPSPKKKKETPTEENKESPEAVNEKPKDLAEESQKADEEMISENLAIIYKNQGKLPKAIEIYEKLILKFPKKEAYFAARIEELKKS